MRRLALAAALLLTGCPKAEPPTPGEVAANLRGSAPSYGALHAAAAGAAEDVLKVKEAGLAELPLGCSPARVKARYSDPNRRTKAAEGEWWEYDEVLKTAAQQDPRGDGRPRHDEIGTLRLLFVPVPPDPKDPDAPTQALSQIQAWAPGSQETRSLVRLLDPVARVTRKYGEPPRKLWMGLSGGEVWVYPASNVAFVISPPQAADVPEGAPAEAPSREVVATIVGL